MHRSTRTGWIVHEKHLRSEIPYSRQNEKDHSVGNSGSTQEISRVVGIVPTKITAFVILILILILILVLLRLVFVVLVLVLILVPILLRQIIAGGAAANSRTRSARVHQGRHDRRTSNGCC